MGPQTKAQKIVVPKAAPLSRATPPPASPLGAATAGQKCLMAVCKAVVVGLTLGSLLTACSEAREEGRRDELARMLAEALPPDTDAEVFATNGFRVESLQARNLRANFEPTDDLVQLVTVTADGTFRVTIEKGRPASSEGGGVGIFHCETGTPMLSVNDRDGDGRIDVLTYAVLDEGGERVLDVIDYEADGQADVRLNFKEAVFEIWHQERWRRVDERDGRRYIVVDGTEVPVETRDNRWIVR